MSGHDELLQQGPREAPEPETAEQRTKRIGKRGLAGGAVAGGAAAAKLGGLKVLLWLVAWNSLSRFGWIGILVVLGLVAAVFVWRRTQREG